jgi:hypothetical protein
VRKLFIGAPFTAATKKELDRAWNQTTWAGWLDGRVVSLPAFGTRDGVLRNGAVGRAWNVTLVDPTTGKHTLRYRIRMTSVGTFDVTWTFTVRS